MNSTTRRSRAVTNGVWFMTAFAGLDMASDAPTPSGIRANDMFAFFCRLIRDRRLRDAGVVVGTLAYQRAMNKGMNR